MPQEKSQGSKRKLLDDSDSESDNGGAPLTDSGFKVNEEYARRFEHNKKREERQRLEEKYKNNGQARNGGNDDDDDESSDDETEDEDGFLATEDLDVQISATLQAIRNKDPRVYDKDVNFFQETDVSAAPAEKQKKEKPVFLRDYHREKILRGDVGASDDEEEAPQTYAQEQDALKKSFHMDVDADKDGDSDSDDDAFMKRKAPEKTDASGVHPSRAATVKATELNVADADKNPENFLSNFLAARAWVAEGGSKWEAFESDDGEDDDDKADEFEQAYNMRFEDPEKSNEVLKSYARDITAARSVRREEKSGRKRRRDIEREKKDEEKKERREEKARLRKLKLEEAEQKLKKIKQTAGATGAKLTDEEWISFLNDAWDDDKWEQEMQKRFGDDYYAMDDGAAVSDDDEGQGEGASSKKKKKPKKPKWDDDIDIKDIIPDFVDDADKPDISLSDAEAQDDGEQGDAQGEDEEEEEDRPSKKRRTAGHKRAQMEEKKKARQERSKLEALVDAKLELTNHDLLSGKGSNHVAFRYRETSPQSFGMTPRDILLAPSDQALNEFAGLKKLATFRDAEKKRRDKKHLGKKARLRQWRRDVFGPEFERTGPTYGFERVLAETDEGAAGSSSSGKKKRKEASDGASNVVGDVGGSRKKRKSKSKKKTEEVEASS